MKDMYTFDVDKSSAMDTYAELNDVYARLFRFIGVPFVKGEDEREGGCVEVCSVDGNQCRAFESSTNFYQCSP